MCMLVHSLWDLVYARHMSVIGLSVLMVYFTGMWMVLNLCVASNQFNVSIGTWPHLWTLLFLHGILMLHKMGIDSRT
jgi:uncharacterized membrane protein SirB2